MALDPLQLLREWTMEGKLEQISLGPERVAFGDRYSFKREALTAYKSQKGKGDFYSLATLLVFLRNKSTPFPQYVKITKDEGVPTVSYLDRKDLEAYLTGQADSSDYIQLVAPELDLPSLVPLQEGQAAEQAEPAAKRARLDTRSEAVPAAAAVPAAVVAPDVASTGADSLMQQVAQQERRLWDRNSALNVPGRNFSRALQLASDDRNEAPRPGSSRQPSRFALSRPAAIPIKPSGRLERQTGPDTTLQDMGFKDIKIQTYGAAATTQANGATNGSAAAPPPPPPPAGALPAPARQAPSAAASSRDQHHRSSSSSARRLSRPDARAKPDPRKGQAPIIIVPKGYETKLNMFNAQAFLEEGKYLTWEECQAAGIRKASQGTFKRTVGRSKPVTYHITDTAPAKTDPAWRRVVAVFVQGKEWQFRDWPFAGAAKGDMVDTFNRMLAVHLVAANEKPPALVKSWNVRILKLHPTDRHGDMQLLRDFYAFLDAHLGAKKSTLAY